MHVQAYKHDGLLHRQWTQAYLVEETDEYWAIASRRSAVTEADGRRWMTKEPAIFLLYKKKWMNVIAMFKESGDICYYVNIASPTIYDKGYLKYIDYDLDIKLYPDKVERRLDEKEYEKHIKHYGYSKDLQKAITGSLRDVERMIAKMERPFDESFIRDLFERFVDENRPFDPTRYRN